MQINRCRHLLSNGWQQCLDGIYHSHGICSRLPLYRQHHGTGVAVPTCRLISLNTVDDVCHLIEANWCAITISNHQRAESGGLVQWTVCLDRERLVAAV